MIRVYDELEDDGTQSTCSLASDASNSSHSMLLRSYCKASRCSAGEHRVSATTSHKHSAKFQLSCSQKLFERSVFSSEVYSTSSQSSDVKHKQKVLGIAHSERKVRWCDGDEHHHHEVNNSSSISAAARISSLEVVNDKTSSRSIKTEDISQSFDVNGDAMARTIYKRNALPRTLRFSELEENEHNTFASSSSYDDYVHRNSHTKSRSGLSLSQSSTSHYQQNLHNNDLSPISVSQIGDCRYSQISANQDDSDDEEIIVTDQSSSSRILNSRSDFLSFFSWRKYFYFTLSKPTHFDVEILARIATFGKWKVILLLLLPLLLLLLGSVHRRGSTMPKQVIPTNHEGKNCHFLQSWWPFSKLVPSFVPSNELDSHHCGAHELNAKQMDAIEEEGADDALHLALNINQRILENFETETKSEVMTKEEMKLLIQEVIKDEISQLLSEKIKQEKLREIEINSIQRELGSFASKFDSLSGALNSFKDKVHESSGLSSEFKEMNTQQGEQLLEIKDKLRKLEHVIVDSSLAAKNCCMNETQLNKKLAAMLLSMVDGKEVNPALKPFMEWLSSRYPSKQQLRDELIAIQQTVKSQGETADVATKKLVSEYAESLRKEFLKIERRHEITNSISIEDVRKTVKDAIWLYDADKTGRTDYALESGGGAVVNTRCSETYNEGRPSLIMFGIPLWNVKSSPRNAIQPDMHPGQCWAFKGSQGYLVIELSATIRPTSFVMEHIPKSLSPSGSIDSAPKEFSVWGLISEKDNDGTFLGEYIYDKDGEPLQHFPIQAEDVSYYPFIELKIHSNHGDLKYTCLYRFRVHGARM